MSFNEIKELRQTGKLDEALQMANQVLETEPDNIWNKRAAAWVYYAFLKKANDENDYSLFIDNLKKINDLNLPEDEAMIFDNSAWQIGIMIFKFKYNEIDKLDTIFDLIKSFSFTKPSENFSFLLKAFLKVGQSWDRFLEFLDWWNFENLHENDYQKEEFEGRKIISIAERSYIAYSKKLLEGDDSDLFESGLSINQNKVKEFLPKLDNIINKHPEYQYPPFYKAKLLIETGQKDEALEALLPFVKKKQKEFWVWELLAEINSDDNELSFSCYSKALSLNSPEEYIVSLRQTYARKLIERNMYDEAKTEILKVINTRESKRWKISQELNNWTNSEWYQNANGKTDNKNLYLKNLNKAEEILFNDVPEELIVIEFVNKNKSILNFIINKNKHGYFKYSNHIKNPIVGDIYKVRFDGDGKNNRFSVLTAEKADSNITCSAIKNFEGNLRKNDGKDFGFIDDIYISPQLLSKTNIENGDKITGKALMSYNKTKNEWGWKAIELN